MARSIEWMKLTAAEVQAAAAEDALLIVPVASLEQHGPALVTGTDPTTIPLATLVAPVAGRFGFSIEGEAWQLSGEFGDLRRRSVRACSLAIVASRAILVPAVALGVAVVAILVAIVVEGVLVEREAVIGRLELHYSFQELADAWGKPSADSARKFVQRAVMRLAELMRSHG